MDGRAGDVRRLSDVIAQLESFSAEVSHELNLIRKLVTPASSIQHHTPRQPAGRGAELTPEPAEAASPPLSPTGRPPSKYSQLPARVEHIDTAAIPRDADPISLGDWGATGKHHSSDSAAAGHDRLARLKERIATRLQSASGSGTGASRNQEPIKDHPAARGDER